MLAAHSENMLRPRGMAPKTPGARRLNDENAVTMGKKALGAPLRGQANENAIFKGKQPAFATPLGGGGGGGGLNRAPLGMKTTNAKTRTGFGGGKQVFKDNLENMVSRPKPKSISSAPKLEIRSDPKPVQPEYEIEVASIAPEIPYESDILPVGGLSLHHLKPENLFGGYYERFLNPVDDNGRRLRELKLEEDLDKALKASECEILHDIENTDWTVADIPESQQHLQKKKMASISRPGSAASTTRVHHTRAASSMSTRSAAAVLGSATSLTMPRTRASAKASNHSRTPSWLQPKKQPTMRDASDPTKPVSRTTIGYTKGRSASATVKKAPVDFDLDMDMDIDDEDEVVVAPSPARKPATRPQFVSIFDVSEESDDESGFKAGSQNIDYDDDDFQL